MSMNLLEIIVFKKNKKKNNVRFEEGLNIITGNSKTGKSALLEIVDYCLLNSQNSIPKGIIENNCILFVIVLKNKDKKIIIAREPYNGEYNGRNNAFIATENLSFDEKKIEYNYFVERKSLYRATKEVSSLILNELGVKVSKRIFYEEESKRKSISLRNVSSYIFQQQNLIANKYALFYRFEDSLKRKSAVEEFPIFMGMIDQRYYELTAKLEEIKKGVFREEKNERLHRQEKEKLKQKKEILENELLSFTGTKKFEELSVIIDEEEIAKKVNELEVELEEIQKKIIQVSLRLYNLERSFNNFKRIEEEIKVVSKTEVKFKNQCPICKKSLEELDKKAFYLRENKERLMELFVSHTKVDSGIYIRINKLEEEKKELMRSKKQIELEKNKILKEIFSLEEKNIRRIIIDKKIEIELIEERIISLDKDFRRENMGSSEREILDLEREIGRYELAKKLTQAEKEISEIMSRIAKKFDFESALGEPNFKVNLKEFDVYQEFLGEKISISSMGSGSNWLTVHLSLFLALNYYFCSLGDKCSVPPILFLDQPSQVYFPDKIDINSEDYGKVEKIYKTILEEIEYTKEKTKMMPQIIIVDHADNLNLGENKKFDSLIRARWKKDGEGFIQD